ncbi:hypothetical protein COCVIDRAFT_37748 [Bipolaris victoriae FI3]|uniref:Uncharacterized protein n=1 Tax=Bipolaris victoriae (strain FI3) TaxID=930091 RepID=W7EMA6_BIPV3|nr:hypothetical protein COCVIDRAFT_37748 [Bipolaris victoriae FI3]
MAKVIDMFKEKVLALPKVASKFTASADERCRVSTPHRCRPLRHGQKKLNVVLQINKEAKSPALVKIVNKFSPHYKMATEMFDTGVVDKQGGLKRVLDSLCAQAKEQVKKHGH